MSKPKPIEYELDEWGITFSSQYWESSKATGTQYYQAFIYWKPRISVGVDRTSERKNFVTFLDAKKWIDEQTSLGGDNQ